MVTTRRQVVNEQEKYDAYEKPASKSRIFVDEVEVNSNEELYTGFSNSASSKTATDDKEFGYTSRTSTVRRARPQFAETEQVRRKRDKEDFMPVITKKFDEKYDEDESSAKDEKIAASTRTKVILAVYLAIVVVLAAIVIGTGIAVTNSLNSVNSLETSFSAKSAIIFDQEQKLSLLSDEANIESRANDMNMGKITNVVEIEVTGGVEAVAYKPRTNWFDAFCDWIGGLFS